MPDMTELKALVEEGNKTITALRDEVEATKAADVVQQEKVARIEKDLAATLAEKQKADAELKAMEKRLAEIEVKAGRPTRPGERSEDEIAHKTAFLDFMRKGDTAAMQAAERKAVDVRVATNASGGFALPKEIAEAINKQLIDISPIRAIARVAQASTSDYNELVDLNGFGSAWLGEVTARAQTNTPDIANVKPTFGELFAYPQATRHAISDLMFDVEAWLIERGAERMAQAEGLAFVSGNGTNQPTGFLAGPTPVTTGDGSRAFGTLQYFATGQAAALATSPWDSLKDMMYGIKAGHRQRGTWVMNSLTLATHAKVKDTTGQYILTPAVREGDPDTMLGKPVVVAEDMPSVAANTFPVAFGDFRAGYLIADIGTPWMLRDEVTTPGWVKFPMAKRVGGIILDSNAIKLLRVSAT